MSSTTTLKEGKAKMVRCPHCQQESVGRFFCDRCRHPLPINFQAALPASVVLPDGAAVNMSAWRGVWPADGRTPRPGVRNDQPCRLYALGRPLWRDLASTVTHRASLTLDVLAPLDVVVLGDAAVVVATALAGGRAALLDADPSEADVYEILGRHRFRLSTLRTRSDPAARSWFRLARLRSGWPRCGWRSCTGSQPRS